jgi:hypothetical protein
MTGLLVMTGDRFDLERFVAAQDADGTYDRALRELERNDELTTD